MSLQVFLVQEPLTVRQQQHKKRRYHLKPSGTEHSLWRHLATVACHLAARSAVVFPAPMII